MIGPAVLTTPNPLPHAFPTLTHPASVVVEGIKPRRYFRLRAHRRAPILPLLESRIPSISTLKTINQLPLPTLAGLATTPESVYYQQHYREHWLIPVVWLQPFSETGIGPGHTTKQSTPLTPSTAFCAVNLNDEYIRTCPHHLCFTSIPSSHQLRHHFSTHTQQPPSTNQNNLTSSHHSHLPHSKTSHQPPKCAPFISPASVAASISRRMSSNVPLRKGREAALALRVLQRSVITRRTATAENTEIAVPGSTRVTLVRCTLTYRDRNFPNSSSALQQHTQLNYYENNNSANANNTQHLPSSTRPILSSSFAHPRTQSPAFKHQRHTGRRWRRTITGGR